MRRIPFIRFAAFRRSVTPSSGAILETAASICSADTVVSVRQTAYCSPSASSLRTMLTTQRLLFTRIKPITHLMSSSEQHTI